MAGLDTNKNKVRKKNIVLALAFTVETHEQTYMLMLSLETRLSCGLVCLYFRVVCLCGNKILLKTTEPIFMETW